MKPRVVGCVGRGARPGLLCSRVLISKPGSQRGCNGRTQCAQARLREIVEWPMHHAGAVSRMGTSVPRGVLLYGPPGCSKTLLARAVASATHHNFVSVKGGELFSKFVGESEKRLLAVFARARAMSPCIIFFDELDAVASGRSDAGQHGQLSNRVLSQLLVELDGLQTRGQVRTDTHARM